MVAQINEITSLQKAPEGWEPQVLSRREWGAHHPAYRPLDKEGTKYPGPRADAEPTDDLPEGSHVPARCSHCGSQFITEQPPLDGDPRGMATCNTCSRQVCWLRPAITAPSRAFTTSVTPERRPAALAAPAPTLRPVISGRFNRADGCGTACTIAYGHDPATHEDYGFKVGQVEQDAKPTGIVTTGCLAFDWDTLETRVNGQTVATTTSDTKILTVLAARLGKLVTRFDLVEQAWGRAQAEIWTQSKDSSAISTHLSRLRQNLGPAAELIETVLGRGVILRKEPPVDDQPRRPRPRVRSGRLHHRLALRPGRDGGLVVARARPRRVRRGAGVQRTPFRSRLENAAMSTANGTATIETVESAVTVAETTPIAMQMIPIETVPQPTPRPAEQPSALDRALNWYGDVVRLRDALAEEEAAILAHLERVRSTRERLSQVVAIFEGPAVVATATPALIAVEPIAQPEELVVPAVPTAAKPWATDHERCINCGTTDEKHAGNGRCKSCSNYWYRKGKERPPEIWSKEQT